MAALKAGKTARDGESFVEIAAFEALEATEDFLGFGEGAVGEEHFSVLFAERSGGGHGLETNRGAAVAGFHELVVPRATRAMHAILLIGG
jgi:hypothetical protein